jgi:hypothetical protein
LAPKTILSNFRLIEQMKIGLLIGLIMLLTGASAVAQNEIHPILESSSIDIEAGKILLNWKIAGGNTCSGIDILRTDNPLLGYSEIGFIDGICGSVSEPILYSFVDEYPIPNSINYYKIAFGTQGSESLQIGFVALDAGGTLIAPNPMVDQSILYFENSGNQTFEFYLFDSYGRKLQEQSDIKTNTLTLNRNDLKAGHYHFLLIGEDGVQYSGTIIVR